MKINISVILLLYSLSTYCQTINLVPSPQEDKSIIFFYRLYKKNEKKIPILVSINDSIINFSPNSFFIYRTISDSLNIQSVNKKEGVLNDHLKLQLQKNRIYFVRVGFPERVRFSQQDREDVKENLIFPKVTLANSNKLKVNYLKIKRNYFAFSMMLGGVPYNFNSGIINLKFPYTQFDQVTQTNSTQIFNKTAIVKHHDYSLYYGFMNFEYGNIRRLYANLIISTGTNHSFGTELGFGYNITTAVGEKFLIIRPSVSLNAFTEAIALGTIDNYKKDLNILGTTYNYSEGHSGGLNYNTDIKLSQTRSCISPKIGIWINPDNLIAVRFNLGYSFVISTPTTTVDIKQTGNGENKSYKVNYSSFNFTYSGINPYGVFTNFNGLFFNGEIGINFMKFKIKKRRSLYY